MIIAFSCKMMLKNIWWYAYNNDDNDLKETSPNVVGKDSMW